MKELWMVFWCNCKELCSYTLRGTFAGERESTIELLAYEKDISKDDIYTTIEER